MRENSYNISYNNEILKYIKINILHGNKIIETGKLYVLKHEIRNYKKSSHLSVYIFSFNLSSKSCVSIDSGSRSGRSLGGNVD